MNKHSLNRVKKKINDYIFQNYHKLFFEKPSPQSEAPQQDEILQRDQILQNPKLLQKAQEELRFSTDQHKPAVDLLAECIAELEERGFLNLLEGNAELKLYKVKDQKIKLRQFITGQLREAGERGLNFESIYKRVSLEFGGFYTKEFVFKAIDELFQMAVIFEISKMTYGLIPEER